jgi:thiosulfate/3-mercaptopyruvate sulfurtransferase
MSKYAYPEVLVSTDWAIENLTAPKTRFVEVDVDTSGYEQGHLQGAIAWNWNTELQDQIRRTINDQSAFEELLGRSGIGNDTQVVLYGDNNNWFAAWAFWQLKYYGHDNVVLIDGGRKKLLAENRPLTTDVPTIEKTIYKVSSVNPEIRAFRDDVLKIVKSGKAKLVDVRSVDEYTGKVIAPPGMNETAQRAGHIPTAQNIPWSQAVKEDGSFKSFDDLKNLYAAKGIDGNEEIVAYCRIGERSSHTWFVLKYLLGYGDVRNYDGSWTEYGNLVNAPIENPTLEAKLKEGK